MPKRSLTRTEYDACCASYRESPGAHAAAGRAAKVDPRTARRMFNFGVPRLGLASISALIADEQLQVRGRINRAEQHARLLAAAGAEDSAASAAKEALAARSIRDSVLTFSPANSRLAAMAARLAEDLSRADVGLLPVDQKVELLGRTLRVLQMSADAVKTSFELERLRLGDPAAPAEGADPPREITIAEYREMLEHTMASLNRFEEMQATEAQGRLLQLPDPDLPDTGSGGGRG